MYRINFDNVFVFQDEITFLAWGLSYVPNQTNVETGPKNPN